jgi:tRNA dimethylallyltransferase
MDILQSLKNNYNLVTVLGPTAGGKTSFAAHLAKMLNSEIISGDSRQVYRGMDLGTGKDIEDYTIDGETVPCHLIDIVDAGEKYNVFQYQKDFFKAFEIIRKKKKTPVMCGGTGLYLDAIVKNYELQEVPKDEKLRTELEGKTLEELSAILGNLKELHNISDIDTKKRAIRAIEIELFNKKHRIIPIKYPKINSFNIGIKFDRAIQKQRITQRLNERLENGMIEEVEELIKKGVSTETLIYYGLEYKFITQHLLKEMSFKEMKEKLNIAIHQFSKRQMTWFRRMEKQGIKIWWINGELTLSEKNNYLEELIKKTDY